MKKVYRSNLENGTDGIIGVFDNDELLKEAINSLIESYIELNHSIKIVDENHIIIDSVIVITISELELNTLYL